MGHVTASPASASTAADLAAPSAGGPERRGLEARRPFERTAAPSASLPHPPRGLVLHLLEELARRGASHEFWASFRNLAPWLNAEEIGFITRRAEQPLPRLSLVPLHI